MSCILSPIRTQMIVMQRGSSKFSNEPFTTCCVLLSSTWAGLTSLFPSVWDVTNSWLRKIPADARRSTWYTACCCGLQIRPRHTICNRLFPAWLQVIPFPYPRCGWRVRYSSVCEHISISLRLFCVYQIWQSCVPLRLHYFHKPSSLLTGYSASVAGLWRRMSLTGCPLDISPLCLVRSGALQNDLPVKQFNQYRFSSCLRACLSVPEALSGCC